MKIIVANEIWLFPLLVQFSAKAIQSGAHVNRVNHCCISYYAPKALYQQATHGPEQNYYKRAIVND